MHFSLQYEAAYKKVVTRTDPQLFLFYAMCYFLVEILILYMLINHRFPVLYPQMFLLGVIFAISTTCLFAAIRISLSQTSLFGTYSIIVSMVLAALFLGESVIFDPMTIKGIRSIAGVLFAIISLWLLTRSNSHQKEKTNMSLFFLILTYIIFDGIGQFWNKTFLASHETMETLVSQMIGLIPFLFVILYLRRISLKITGNSHIWIAFDSIAEVGFAIFLLLSFKLGPISLILPIQKLATIIGGMLLGLIVFNEKHSYTKIKKIGLLVGITGIILLIF